MIYSLRFILMLADALINQFEVFKEAGAALPRLLPFAVEASWVTGKWDKLDQYLEMCPKQDTGDFNIGIGTALSALRHGDRVAFKAIVNDLRYSVAKSLTVNSVASLQSCHDSILRLHALTEVESIADAGCVGHISRSDILGALNRRLDVIGGYLSDKQYLLGLRRATMELS